jgi:transcriptional regulator with XRE-family HTH domain
VVEFRHQSTRSATSNGSTIADARHGAGLTQRELAERIGVPLWTVARIERGDRAPGPHLAAVAAATGRSADSLLAEPARGSTETAQEQATPDAPEDSGAAAGEATDRFTAGHWSRNIIFASIVTLATIRFFAEDIGVLPRAVKFVDVPILLFLLVLSWAAPRVRDRTPVSTRYLLPAVAFLAVCVASVLLNSGRAEPGPALLFIYGFLAPILLFHLVRTLWPTGHALSFSRLLVALAWVEFAVVLFIDLPQYLNIHDPDLVSGTFGENAYQLVFFLLMAAALVAGISTVERGRPTARLAPLFFAATVATCLLAQYRAITLTFALTVLLIATLVGLVRVRGAVAGLLIALAFGAGILLVPSVFPELGLQRTIDTLTGNPGSYVSHRLEAGSDIVDIYTDEPRSTVVGAGPATFSSRAWETYYSPDERGRSGIALPFPASLEQTDIAQKYMIPRLRDMQTIEGSFAVVEPAASYYALLAEVGLLGFVLMVAIYGRAFLDSARMSLAALRSAPDGDPLPGLMLASTAGFFVIIQMGIFQNWWEVTRLTFILWTVFAVATKEFEARYGTAPRRRHDALPAPQEGVRASV